MKSCAFQGAWICNGNLFFIFSLTTRVVYVRYELRYVYSQLYRALLYTAVASWRLRIYEDARSNRSIICRKSMYRIINVVGTDARSLVFLPLTILHATIIKCKDQF